MQSNGSYRKLKDVRPTFLPGGHKVPVSKRIQFNWADPDDRGEYMDIPKDHLEVDHTYQRDTVSIERINSIAREFRWAAFGVLLIIRRSDGTLWVYDGQHRLAAAKLRDDIDDLPCLVFNAKTIAQEADAFCRSNNVRGAMRSVDAYKAALVAEDPTALGLCAALEEWDYKIASTNGPGRVKCVAALMTEFKADAARFRRALQTCYVLLDAHGFEGWLFRGLCAMDRHTEKTIGENLSTPRIAAKLATLNISTIEKERKSYQALESASAGEAYRVALLKLLNKGWRNKLPVAEGDA